MSDSQRLPGDEQYWYNTKTREVEKGHKSSWTHLMGPYATEAEAASALAKAEARNDAWQAEDDKWK
ncbi:SPOR domain-containing protein [Saxibacter everestensis]|uniref:SPOR domain-containing protein n=1 Tax=Saxibacter everestensis TaxID=2909229 RepID=A0ABY8QWQ1_9MICO|nr:SPOR domain-containing protein [Brevibacteriaceae bacterium ZFBP1038]